MMLPADFYLIRGLAREAAHWGDFIPLLEAQPYVHQVVALDLLGTGRYHRMTSPLSIQENAEFLLSQIPESKEHPKVIVSISLGSMVAVEMAQKRPDLFQRVFVMNTSFANLSPIHHRLQLDAFKRFYRIAKTKSLQERELEVIQMVSQVKEKQQALSEEWAEIARQRPMPVKNFFRQLIAAATYKIVPQPPDVPIVVLRSLGDQMVDPSCSQKLSEHWNLPLHTHPSAGHDLSVDAPDWILQIISEYQVS